MQESTKNFLIGGLAVLLLSTGPYLVSNLAHSHLVLALGIVMGGVGAWLVGGLAAKASY